MVHDYVDATDDDDFVRDNFDLMEKEYAFWQSKRSVTVLKGGDEFRMYRYNCESQGPRPESYLEDFELGQACRTTGKQIAMHSEIQTAAESGWDFSSRWFQKSPQEGDLKDTMARSVIPVDLNSIMARNSQVMSQFCRKIIKDD